MKKYDIINYSRGVGKVKVNRHGQALIEFVLVLPILLLIIFAFLDFGRIILCKNHLENTMSEVVSLYKDNSDIQSFLQKDNDYKITFQIQKSNYTKIILETKLDLITPGLNKILNNPYKVSVERSVLDE